MSDKSTWLGATLMLSALTQPAVSHAADMSKTLRVTFQVAETGFDPTRTSDYYSGMVIEAIYDRLLTYDYLARPSKLVPLAAESLPLITDNGKTYTFKIKKGIYFTPDPAFKGKRRELTAEDYAYSIKRFFDPRNRSPYAFLFEGKIVGLDELGARARKAGRFDYDAKVPGLEVPDRYTLRIHLKEIDYGLSHILAFDLSGAVAREVIELYGEDTSAHPVGSGPYRLKHYARSSKIILEANPGYREKIWDFQPGDDPLDKEIAAQMKGKRLPAIGNVEISIMEETQSRWLAFEKGETDLEYQLWDVATTFMTADGKLKPAFLKRGIKLNRTVDPEITYTYFNMLEKIGDQPNPVGGYSLERIALRRAIAMAYKTGERIRILRKGQAVRAEHPIPPGIAGYDPNYVNSIPYDPKTANALLDRFGYKKGADGYRRMPDGKPLVIRFSSTERDRPYDELMQRSLDSIAIRLEIHKDRFPELLKLERRCRIMMRNAAWIADYPDGDNFMQLLYGPNTQQSNNACYQSPEFDKLYEKSKTLPDGPERNKLYWAMARRMEADTAWIMNDSRVRNMLMQPRVIGYKRHPALHQEWMYLDLDSSAGK
ncbi:MAG: heme-binding protein [Betaproteobacteria bacterium]|nr:MAG: heme-binding protein [Betaproteobacteria bacterium]TMH81756.1 MAG: heme-binding protein [Betaproteobacteria bacterium]